MQLPLVSVIIPTKNSSKLLQRCLDLLRRQSYKNIEIIIVDGKSHDLDIIKELVKRYHCILYIFVPKVKKGLFDATKKRNYAAKLAKGKYIYHFDADMEITKNVIAEAVSLCEKKFDALIIPEDSFGEGVWASAKNLERRFFWGDDTIESPRFFKTSVWHALKGYDENIAGGGDDRDIYQKALQANYHIGRTKNLVLHNEGKLTLTYLMKKQFMYKREAIKYIRKRPLVSIQSYFPIRKAHITHWRRFLERPKDTVFFIIMKTAESFAGLYGILYSLIA
jgi:glycosyltransferase involved in cell wall biosynthesis